MDPINVNIHANNNEFEGFEITEHHHEQLNPANVQQNQQQAGNVQAQNPAQNPQPQPQQDPIRQHIRNIERQKNQARQGNNQQGNNAGQQNQQNQQQQQNDPVPQQVQEEGQQLAQHNIQIAQAQLENVRVLNVNQSRKQNFTLVQPSVDELTAAYTLTGFEYTSSPAERQKLVREATTRRALQGTFRDKIEQVQQHPVRATSLTRAKAIGYSDKYLVSHYGQFNGPATEYLALRYSLMKNKYYSILPVQELKKLSRLDIMNRLVKEMKKANPDQELVLFYQNLVELQNMEAEETFKPVRKNPAHPAVEITAKERKNNASYCRKLQQQILGNRALSGEEKTRRILRMNNIMNDENQSFWQEKTAVEKKNITPEKREGVRSILAWMYRHCDTGSKSKEPMVNVIANAKPDQILHILYLIENKMETVPTAESYFEATTNYIPNLDVFSDRANWTKISQVAGFVLKNQLIGSFLELDEEEERLKGQLDANNPNPLNDAQREDAKLQLIFTKAHKIMRMYSAAGLEPNMPIQLIPSAVLREKITAEVQELVGLYNNLSEQLRQRLQNEAVPDADHEGDEKAEKIKNKKKIGTKNAQKHVSDAKSISGHVMQGNTLLKVIGEDAEFITKNFAYSLTTSGISGVLAIVGLISSVMSAVNLSKATATMTGFDISMKRVGLAGEFLSGFSNIGKTAGDVIKTIVGGTSEKLPWIGRTSPLTYAESLETVPGAIQFCAGGVMIVAGTLQLISNGMSTHQARQSLKKLDNAKNSLTTFNEETEAIQDEQTREKRQLQSQRLKNLMDHRKDLATKQRDSSIVGMVGAGLVMIGGALTMTGMLAPIGGILSIAGSVMNIAYGMIYAKKAKKASLKKAVDDGIKLDELVTAVKTAYNIQNLSKKEEEKLRDQVRQEALAELGYSDYKAMYLGLCKEQAEDIYHYVFEGNGEDPQLKESYKQILLSLKFKENQIYRAQHPYERNYPPLSLIYSRLTEGL